MATAAVLVLSPGTDRGDRDVHALPKFDPPGGEGDLEVFCGEFPPRSEIAGRPWLVGYSVVGFAVQVDARIVKIRWGSAGCGADVVVPLGPGQFTWSVVAQPAGSSAVLTDTETLTPRLRLDREGSYLVRLIVCQAGCPVGELVQPAESFDVPIQAVTSAPLAPETVPIVPAADPAPRTVLEQNHCSFGAGFVGAQWWAVRQIEGPADYRRLEGLVERSRVSRKDTPMNHDSQDFNFHVRPDGPSRGLLFAGSPDTTVEVEWETRELPEMYRPTRGDRVSVFGHWIYDCAHEDKAEIHPPVGVAVQRPRPVAIPAGQVFPELGGAPVGEGVYVPGVITDVFFSERGGRLLDCSVDTGLKNANRQTLPGPAGPIQVPTCIPRPSLDHIFEFNILLPRDPRKTMAAAGFSVPPVPLYVGVSAPPGASSDNPPVVERVDTADGATHLRVRLDLRGYPGEQYLRRIVAGWVLPADDNWGLGSWRLLLHRLDVANDGDGTLRGDGDWRLWINTNNAGSDWPSGEPTQEWVQILNRDVHGVVDFGGSPWQTGLDAPRSLGPDLLRYPPRTNLNLPAPVDYGILFHSTGYEADGAVDDDAGTVDSTRPALAGSYAEPNRCTNSGVLGDVYYSGCVQYTAHYEVAPGPPLPPARLTAAARDLAARYVLSCPRGAGGDDVGVCSGLLAPAAEVVATHPLQAVLEPGSGPVDITTTGPFSPGKRELAFTELSSEDLHRIAVLARRTDPESLERTLTALRAFYDGMLADEALALDAYADLAILRVSLPADLWAEHFGDIPKAPQDHDLPRAKLTGHGIIPSATGGVRAKHLLLHCAAERRPNRLSLRWGPNRFDLDLALEARCDPDPRGDDLLQDVRHSLRFPTRVNAGRGIGRYNGVPGAVVEWRLADGGGWGWRQRDTAAVVVRSAGAVVLNASGDLRFGNLTAEGWKWRPGGGHPGHPRR